MCPPPSHPEGRALARAFPRFTPDVAISRERAKLAKLEVKRIATLVERAKNNDPRLRAHREMLKQKAEEEKAAALLKKQQLQEEKV